LVEKVVCGVEIIKIKIDVVLSGEEARTEN